VFCNSCGAQFEGSQQLCEKCRGVTQGKPERSNLNILLALAIGFALAAAYSYLMFDFVFGELANSEKTLLTEILLSAGLGGVALVNALCVFMKWRFTVARVALVVTVLAGILAIWVSAQFSAPSKAQTYAVTGQLLTASSDGSKPIVGASVYFFPTQYASELEYLTQLEHEEAGAISLDKSISEWSRCSEQLWSILRENTGLAGPLDARFYPIKSLWYAAKKDPKFLAWNPAKKREFEQQYWQTQVADDPEFAKLAPSDLERYRKLLLVGDNSDKKAQAKLAALPSVTSDSRGEFASRLPKGRHLLVAWGMDSASGMDYLWAIPFTVDGDTRFVTGDVICEARPF
jgi:hypothetical protein